MATRRLAEHGAGMDGYGGIAREGCDVRRRNRPARGNDLVAVEQLRGVIGHRVGDVRGQRSGGLRIGGTRLHSGDLFGRCGLRRHRGVIPADAGLDHLGHGLRLFGCFGRSERNFDGDCGGDAIAGGLNRPCTRHRHHLGDLVLHLVCRRGDQTGLGRCFGSRCGGGGFVVVL